MTNKSLILIFGALILIAALPLVVASVCCEKTTYDGWCQNEEDENLCNVSFQKAPTSCDSASFCRKGCCYSSVHGTCDQNVAQRTCNEGGGTWDSSADCSIPQCDLGCCLIGDQAAFVSQVRCKRMSSLYGLAINYRTDIETEAECVLSVTSDVEGACVFERDFENTCLRTTQAECGDLNTEDSPADFYPGFLCSAETLGTNCGRSEKTTCVENRDEVFYLDSCGNLANVYDASKNIDDDPISEDYWAKIQTPDCGDGEGSKNSNSCGACNYYEGSTCKKGGNPTDGEYICKDLDCENGAYRHGETWCELSGGVGSIAPDKAELLNLADENIPGSRYFRKLCYNGEILVEPCADFRQEVCIQSSIGDFRTASCRVNKWQDCIAQRDIEDCMDRDLRDCEWFPSDMFEHLGDDEVRIIDDDEVDGVCVPKYAPGLNFWGETNTDVTDLCGLASRTCIIKYERGARELIGDSIGASREWEAVDEEECDPDDGGHDEWLAGRALICSAMGDCGAKINYLGYAGDHNLGDLTFLSDRMDAEELDDEYGDV